MTDIIVEFEPFRPHPLLRGGHLQTFATTFIKPPSNNLQPKQIPVDLSDGDLLFLYDDLPQNWNPGDGTIIIVHGLGSCHRASYMLRLAKRFYDRGVRVFRVDMRASGLGLSFSSRINHAGRSEDVLRLLEAVHAHTSVGPIAIVGVSLGGNQLLKLLGELGDGIHPHSAAIDRLTTAIAIAPPVNLIHCSSNMQRWIMRPYNRYFIKLLLSNIPPLVRQSQVFQQIDLTRLPRTLFELDEVLTAPLSGFAGAHDYYQQSSSINRLEKIFVPTLVIAAKDDPIVPIAGYENANWSSTTRLEVTPGGGHVAYLAAKQCQQWLDRRIEHWIEHFGFLKVPVALGCNVN